MFPIACYQATGQHYAHSALNDRFPAILNAQNPAIPSAHPHALPAIKKCHPIIEKNPVLVFIPIWVITTMIQAIPLTESR